MRTIASLSLVTLLAVSLAGCYPYDRRYGGGYRNPDRDTRDPECRDGGGRVDMRRWEAIVDDFLSSGFRGPQEFRRAKRQLLDDLNDAYERACGWERNGVQRLWQRVRDYRYRNSWD